jgi:tellurite methyltransferase
MTAEWSRYYEAAGDTPRDTLLLALALFDSEATANGLARFGVDLGCGSGRDTAELLRRGWRVLAIDAEVEAIGRLRARADLGTGADTQLVTRVAPFEVATWPQADLVNASFSLPFCPPDRFRGVWERIVASLGPGGRFSGQLFGDRDGWAQEADMSFQTRHEAQALLRQFELERFDEIEEDGKTAIGKPKHWHVFHVVARKR